MGVDSHVQRNTRRSSWVHGSVVLRLMVPPTHASPCRSRFSSLPPPLPPPLLLPQSICSSLGLPDGAVYDLYAKLRNTPEVRDTSSGLDGTVIVVNTGRGDEGGAGGSGVEDGGVAGSPSAFAAAPAAYATFE